MNIRQQHGLTLVEALISIATFAIFAVLINTIFFNILRSGTKQNVERELRQNGSIAMQIMRRRIQEAEAAYTVSGATVGCDQPAQKTLRLENSDGTTTTFSLVSDPTDVSLNRIQATTNPGGETEWITGEILDISTANATDFFFRCMSFAETNIPYQNNYIEIRMIATHHEASDNRGETFAELLFESGALSNVY